MPDPQTENDSKLMRQVAEGDEAAFLQLYDQYASRVFGLLLSMTGERRLAEDLLQESFTKVWTSAASFRSNRGRLSTWLLTIARRTAIDRFRRQSRRPQTVSETALHSLPGSQRSVAENRRWRALRFAVDDLPQDQRVAIQLAYFYGLSHSEIAKVLEIPLGTVKTRIRLGMQKLRRAWLQRGDASDGRDNDV